MRYFLDTNAASHAISRRKPAVKQRLDKALEDGHDIAISSIAIFELWFGVVNSAYRAQQEERVNLFLSMLNAPVDFTMDDAKIAAEIRGQLQPVGQMIGLYDLQIASQALRLDATLVTANVREFERVPGLRWEDWSLP